jgi:AmmeMemoRadiSam system protein A
MRDNMVLTEKDKRYLLELARKAIIRYLDTGERLELNPASVPAPELARDGACFVTLRYKGQLRGCIGTLEAKRPLALDVAENAVASAFEDPRFPMLTKAEFPDVDISISVLTVPKPFPVGSPEELLEKLEPGKHGLILEKGFFKATFLPAVWKQLPDKNEFLKCLSMKAGLLPDGWKDPDVKFYVYESEEFSE